MGCGEEMALDQSVKEIRTSESPPPVQCLLQYSSVKGHWTQVHVCALDLQFSGPN